MHLPFEIPKSLASYAEQYERKPEKTIKRFKKQLQRRGPDAVGYLMLAWFHYQQKDREKAVDYALKAKTLAPGSPFFDKLHYFFSHPQTFDAWRSPATNSAGFPNRASKDLPGRGYKFSSSTDLNSLIEKLSKVESKRIQIDADRASGSKVQAFDAQEVDSIVSETLAKVHEEQNNYAAAIHTYQILKMVKKDRADFYDERIAKLEELKSKEGEK